MSKNKSKQKAKNNAASTTAGTAATATATATASKAATATTPAAIPAATQQSKAASITRVGNYVAVPLAVSPGDDSISIEYSDDGERLNFKDGSVTHTLFVKKNTDEDGRTLFVLNVPIDATDAHLRSVFRSAGAIDSVKLNGKIVAHPLVDTKTVHTNEDGDGNNNNNNEEQGEENESEEQTTRKSSKRKNRGGNANANASVNDKKRRKDASGKATASDAEADKIAPPVLRELVYSGSSAHIVFLESESVDRIVNGNWSTTASNKKQRQLRTWPTYSDLAAQGYKEFQDGSIPDTGISMWLAEYRSARPATELLQRDADTAIKAYNEAVAEQQRQLAEVAAEPDDDGFTLVTRRGTGGATKHGTVTDASGTTVSAARAGAALFAHQVLQMASAPPVSASGILPGSTIDTNSSLLNNTGMSPEATLAALALAKKKAKKKKELDNFYRFQVRESKREKLVQLRSKFEEDKKRIAALKESRKFKPF